MNEHARQADAAGFSLDLHGAFIRRTDLSHANLEGANLSGADCTNAIFRGANLKNAILSRTVLRGADLAEVKNLTIEQLSEAIIDESTILPAYIDRARLGAA